MTKLYFKQTETTFIRSYITKDDYTSDIDVIRKGIRKNHKFIKCLTTKSTSRPNKYGTAVVGSTMVQNENVTINNFSSGNDILNEFNCSVHLRLCSNKTFHVRKIFIDMDSETPYGTDYIRQMRIKPFDFKKILSTAKIFTDKAGEKASEMNMGQNRIRHTPEVRQNMQRYQGFKVILLVKFNSDRYIQFRNSTSL